MSAGIYLKGELPGEWFPEPRVEDESIGPRDETISSWLDRSTGQKARHSRHFLNDSIRAFPGPVRDKLVCDLRTRWPTAYFELVLGRTLQALGATIEIEPANSDGKHLDFVARFGDGSVAVEAISPAVNAAIGEQMGQHRPLLSIIDRLTPPAWNVDVISLPAIGPSDSRQQFELAIRNLMDTLPVQAGDGRIELDRSLPNGDIRMVAFRRRYDRPIVIEPGAGYVDNTECRIRNAIKKKRHKGQARTSTVPVLLAINTGGTSDDLAPFDRALFGHTNTSYDQDQQIERVSFVTDGELTRRQHDKPPAFAGVLAFAGLGLGGGRAPVLYHHPRFAGVLPAALAMLEQRSFHRAAGRVTVEAAQRNNVLAEIGLIHTRH